MKTFVTLSVFYGLLYAISALSTSQWTNLIQTGVWDDWNRANPENVRGGNFEALAGNDKLWLVSKRLWRNASSDDPWDPALRGGIVSEITVPSKTVAHKSYDRVDVDPRAELLFVAINKLFMLTYSVQSAKVTFQKLFVYNQDGQGWTETPLEVEAFPAQTLEFSPRIYAVEIVVPKADGDVAYIATSSHTYAQRGSEMLFYKVNVQTTKTTIKPLVRKIGDEPSAVKALAVKSDNSKLVAFVSNFYSEGYVPEYSKAYVVDLAAKQVSEVQTSGTAPNVDASNGDNFFQTGDTAFVTGGTYSYGLGQTASSNKIWSLDLNTMQWSESQSQMPPTTGKLAFDQNRKKLYSIRLREGITETLVTP